MKSNFEYSVYCKPTNENDLLHFLFFHDIEIKILVLSGSCLGALIVCGPINLNSEIQFLYTIFSNLGYPKYLIDQVFSATKKKFYNLPPPLNAKEPSTTLVLHYDRSLKQF